MDGIRSDLLDALDEMKTAASNGDATTYNSLKEKVGDLKSELRVAEIKAEDSRHAYVDAVSKAPGYVPDITAMAPSSSPSLLHQDVIKAQKKVSDVQVENRAGRREDARRRRPALQACVRGAQEGGSPQAEALEETQGELVHAKQRIRPDATEEERLDSLNQPPPPSYASPVSSPLPRYQGPPAVVSVDAKHVRWFKNPKGSITGAMGASPGSHVEMAEIENVVPYPVRPDDGLVLNGGDLLLPPPMPRSHAGRGVVCRHGVKFMAAPLDNSCLFHMGDGEDNMFRLKFQEVC